MNTYRLMLIGAFLWEPAHILSAIVLHGNNFSTTGGVRYHANFAASN
jgi:hypothetical protein